jgi:hypothetical protein
MEVQDSEGVNYTYLLVILPVPTAGYENVNGCQLQILFIVSLIVLKDHLYGLVVRVPGYRSRSLGSIPGATRSSEN